MGLNLIMLCSFTSLYFVSNGSGSSTCSRKVSSCRDYNIIAWKKKKDSAASVNSVGSLRLFTLNGGILFQNFPVEKKIETLNRPITSREI